MASTDELKRCSESLKEKVDLWHNHYLRLKSDKAVVKLHYNDGSFMEAINTPSVMWPLNGHYQVFHYNNCELIENEVVKDIVNQMKYRIGHCYSNAEAVTKALFDAGFHAKMYVGWLFLGNKQYPIHHAWTVLDGIHVIDLADDFALQSYNKENFAIVKTEEERRLLLLSFTKWARELPHTKRCMPFGVPSPILLYIGSECNRETGIQIYNNLMTVYPNHPCSEKVQKSGMTRMQEMFAKEGIMD